MSMGKHEMEAQAPPDFSDSQQARQSSDIDYEIAHQLIQHAQGKSDPNEANTNTPPTEPEPPDGSTSQYHTDQRATQRATNGKLPPNQDTRRSISQDRMSESQYAPLKNPPAMGQMCT